MVSAHAAQRPRPASPRRAAPTARLANALPRPYALSPTLGPLGPLSHASRARPSFRLLTGCERDDAFDASGETACNPRAISQITVLCLVIQQGAAVAYAAAWYLDVPYGLQQLLKGVASILYTLVSVAAIIYMVQAFVLLFLAITVKPEASVTTLILLGTPFLYMYLTANAMMKAKPTPPAIDILVATVTGAVILLGLVGWLMLAIVTFLPPTGNALGTVGAGLGCGCSAMALGTTQINKLNRLAGEFSPDMKAAYSA